MRYVFDAYLLDTQRYELSCRGKAIKLRPNVFEVLDYLIRHRDRVVSKDELLEHLWPQQFIADGTLNACLMAVRKAIGDSGQTQRRIKTLHGRGYRFVAAVEEQEHQLPGGTTRTAEYAAPGAAGQTPEQGALLAVPEPPPTTHETPSAPPFPREASSSPALHILDQEHKLVTVLCCGLTEAAALATRLGAEAMHHRMQAFLARVQTTVERYGGTMIQYGVDGFMALFGAPMADEDRARRAVLAARALQQELLRQRCHITDTDVPDTIRSKVYAAVQEAIIGSEEDIALLLQLLDVPVENSSLAHDTPNVQLQTAELLSEVSSLPAGVSMPSSMRSSCVATCRACTS